MLLRKEGSQCAGAQIWLMHRERWLPAWSCRAGSRWRLVPTQHHHFREIDGLGLLASGRGAAAPLPSPTKLSRYPGHQRSRLTRPTPGAAR